MSFVHWLVIASAIISITGASVYIRDTLKGKTKPNRVTWSMWALSPLIGVAAAISSHADLWATTRIFLAGFLPLLVFIASFINPRGYWKLTLFDFLCGACSIFALVVWGIANSPQMAILFAVIADGFATIPTLRKAWIRPETETGIIFVGSFISVLLIIPSIPRWNIENSAFQVYLLIASILLLFVIYRKRLGL